MERGGQRKASKRKERKEDTHWVVGVEGEEEGDVSIWQRSSAPLFEAFWQGRLIPGARIESLPFIEVLANP